MSVEYVVNRPITREQFIELLRHTSLGERRPLDDAGCLDAMLANANLLVTAWQGDKLVGLARSLTDFSFACYLSDLAVHEDVQRLGIGRQLIRHTQQMLGPRTKLILLAAPAAADYYGPLGFEKSERCWVLERSSEI